MAHITDGLYPPDHEPVPTVPELARKGLAKPVTATYVDRAGEVKKDTRYQVSDEGQQLIYDAMKRNAERGRMWNARKLATN